MADSAKLIMYNEDGSLKYHSGLMSPIRVIGKFNLTNITTITGDPNPSGSSSRWRFYFDFNPPTINGKAVFYLVPALNTIISPMKVGENISYRTESVLNYENNVPWSRVVQDLSKDCWIVEFDV